MLTYDSTAYVEELRMPPDEKLQAKQKREAANARLELVRQVAELHALTDELDAADRARHSDDDTQLSTLRRLRYGRRPTSLTHEVESRRRRLKRKHEEVHAKRLRVEELERDAAASSKGADGATAYRLHSARLYVTLTRKQYEHLLSVQRTVPVWLTTQAGLRWWWYLDRYWWADAHLSAQEIATLVLTRDLATQNQREAIERAESGLTGGRDEPSEDIVEEEVRREVWFRDRGRCVDCGSGANMVFDRILPLSFGGANTAPNLQLRCRGCQGRRRANEVKAAVEKARIGAHAAKEWGVELANPGWPRPV